MSECAMELTGGSCVYAVTLPPDNGSVPVARHTAGAVLASWGLEDYVDVAGLLLSELVTNAIQHSGGAREFVLVYLVPRSGLLHVEVHDHCSTVPVPRQAKINEENGRGCELLDALALEWGSSRRGDGSGNITYFDLQLDDAA
jgi:anti-sigma regulatory factor (Ser/Thr protein kinase)